ncbi:Protein stu-1 [Ceratocystis platani]|uniref:Protein stu-1 n=1 Tax=Ceratocystis fimbriata f. sp. platani TaxID=88771 RepID=A0A0F8B5C4_CERFI|nr:Protein stu-1 [Ceratocystis platani]
MPEKLTDEFVADLLNLLRSDVYVDSKVSQVTYTKSSIKQFNVPETCTPALFEALRLASLSPHATLSMAGFTALNHLFTRLLRQESKLLAKEAPKNLSLVIERLGDQKEKLRALANQILINIYPVAPVDVERFVRNIAMSGKNVRAKEAALNWLLHMHQETGMPFRNYVPNLMDLLEDADPGVRETAKGTVIELFKNAPNRAKSDLKRQLKNCKVRPAIEQAIVKALIPTVGSEATSEEQPRANLAPSTSMPSLSSDRPVTPGNIETNAESLEPIYVNTVRELDDMFKEMLLYFDGRESEQNWLKREQSISKLRQLIVGNVPSDFQDQFLVGLKSLLDGIVKAITSLRTSLSKEGCALVQDAANVFGPGIDPLVEILLQTLIKLCAATKKIASQQANTSVEAIISRVTYSNRIMQHIWGASQDKNVQPRLYSTSWLKIMLTKEGHHKSHIEHTGGLDIIEKCLKKGLNDANPGVRERSRGTYWLFSSMWPARAEAIMEGLDSTAQKLLTKDPANPNAGANTTTAKPGMGLSKSTMSAPNAQDMMDSDKAKVNARLLDSGITRVKAKTLDVHGFRKLQSLLREKTIFADGKFDSLLLGLFQYLEDPLPGIATDKAQDVKAQVLATIKLLLKNNKPSFQPHVSRALEAIMATRSTYDARTHIVSGLEALADDLVVLGSAPALVNSLVALLNTSCSQDASVASAGMRCLSTGLHVLTAVLARHPSYIPGADGELPQLAGLAGQCLESKESAVRMGAVQLCVAVHARVGEEKFWEALKDVQDDPKSLITYYIVKRQRDGSE